MPPIPKVVLIGNDPQFVYLIQRYARRSGSQLIHAGSISHIMPLAQEQLPQLILLDVVLNRAEDWPSQPWLTVQALKADPVTAGIRVFVCSASEVATRGWEEYVDGCLLKPVMYEDFVAALGTVTPHHLSDTTRQD